MPPDTSNQRPTARQMGATGVSSGLSSSQPGQLRASGSQTGQQSQNSLPAISLPKGGGAIRGIGEKFDVNPVTGTGSLSVPIATSPSRQDFYPKLRLSYDSGGGNGPFGLGWGLSIPSITRKTDKGIPRYRDYEDSDTFILSGAEDLVPTFKKEEGVAWALDEQGNFVLDEILRDGYRIRRYRPRVEGLFARIERWQHISTDDIFWRAITRDNVVSLYGLTANSRISDPDDECRVFQWLLSASFDDRGNLIVYEYKPEDAANVDSAHPEERNRLASGKYANRYVKHIKYGNRTPFERVAWLNMVHTWLAQADRPSHPLAPADPDWFLFEVLFDYGEHDAADPLPNSEVLTWPARVDAFSSYRAGFEIRTQRLCRRVLMFHRFDELARTPYLVRSTHLTHDENPFAAYLTTVTQTGHRWDAERSSYVAKSLPPLAFTYSEFELNTEVHYPDAASLENLPIGLGGAYQWVDLDGEGISGVLSEQGEGWFFKPNLGRFDFDIHSSGNGPPFAAPQATLRESVRFGPMELVATKPSLADLQNGGQQILDLAGDGQKDLVLLGTVAGFYKRGDSAWINFRPFKSIPQVDWADPNLRFVDLNGDGHADILVSEHEVFVWYQSQAEDGFGPSEYVRKLHNEEQGPALIFADASQSIYLADMSGDGLVDLARIRNGEVCYWPNLGYGRFGAKVTMGHAPTFDAPDQFSQARIRLVDIDGSGTTDIIYLGRNRIDIYRNQAGNRWHERESITEFPSVDSLSSVMVVDLLGAGTACLVWSSSLPKDASRPMAYVDLMGGKKPHLLTKTINNLGAETQMTYASSTKFYLADQAAGQPWITKLPFPVHVLERVTIFDHISHNRFVTRYAYHHGYFDGQEREFRGFGRVDQWDTEEYATLEDDGLLSDATNLDEASHVPPVLTRTWFHTGAFLDGQHISTQYTHEYYGESDPSMSVAALAPAQRAALLLKDTVLPTAMRLTDGTAERWESYRLSAEEAREATRALKGSLLRQEIYALDGTGEQDRPYSVSESNYTIEIVQPEGRNRLAVIFTNPREAINFHYERKLYKVEGSTIVDPGAASPEALDVADPRVSHAMTLDVDSFGNVRQAVAIGYGRRYEFSDATLDTEMVDTIRAKQGQTLVTYTESRYTNAVDTSEEYRTPLPCAARTYELTGFERQADKPLFTFDDFVDVDGSAVQLRFDREIAYHEAAVADSGRREKRLIEDACTRYRRNDFDGLLPLGELESWALPGESYQLALTPALLDALFRRGGVDLLPDRAAMLAGTAGDQGGYVDLDGDGRWWIPSGRVFYHRDSGAGPTQELDEARAHFFLPRRFQDPFGQNTVVTYEHDLLVAETQDAIGNRVTAANDYRVLQSALVTDPNGNRAAVSFDTLGLVAGTAVMGKEGEARGDLLDEDFRTALTETEIDGFFAEPRGPLATTLLGTATTRIIYDLDRYRTSGAPAFAATLARETHVSDLSHDEDTKIQVNLAYSDGFGRVIQQKVQAEPGAAPQRDPATDQILVDANNQPVMTEHDVTPRWVGSGWTVFNNKGKPVSQYEPFFSDRHDFEFDVRIGVSSILCYDPVGRVVATVHPNHTYEKVVFDPWQQATWDVNDTVTNNPTTDPDVGSFVTRLPDVDYLPTWYQQRIALPAGNLERIAADKAAVHAATPTRVYFDTLGRPVVSVAHNKFEREDRRTGEVETVEEHYTTRTELDIEGKPLAITDARGNPVMRYYRTPDIAGHPVTAYDVAGRLLYQNSMDAGERWMLANVAGNPIRRWDSRDFTHRMAYDELQRPTQLWVQEGDVPAWLAESTIYGERHPEAEARNLRGQGYQLYDGAGMVISDAFDFKGNLLRSHRQLANNYRTAVDWSAVNDVLPTATDEVLNLAANESASASLLESEIYASRTVYDALNRPIQQVTPHDVAGRDTTILPNIIQPRYNEANLLNSIAVWLRQERVPDGLLDPATADQHPVINIDYNAKGQRTVITYGNDVVTEYTYDWETFRLTRLHTRRPTSAASERELQELHYTYDPTGNITHIRDDAQQTIFFRNQRVEPSAAYTYDALYRLIEATGREHLGQNPSGALKPPVRPSHTDAPRVGLDHPNNGEAMGNYTEWYAYDPVGNILSMSHCADSGVWRRCCQYELDSNHLLSTSAPGEHQDLRVSCPTYYAEEPVYAERYTYDAHGNMTSMPHLPAMQWDFKDQLHEVDLEGGGTSFYVYDAAGQRVRKVHKHNGATVEERIYLGGYEIYRWRNGSDLILTRETLHVMDGQQRIVMVETRTQGDEPGMPAQLVRYQLGNHLGSATVELDVAAQIVSYEEYFPYGSTSYQAVRSQTETSKRYRYTGMERDEETGLNYHTARYYVPWLGRWLSSDPIGLASGNNMYQYSRNNPVLYVDRNGLFDFRLSNDTLNISPEYIPVSPIVPQSTHFYDTPVDSAEPVNTRVPREAVTTPRRPRQTHREQARSGLGTVYGLPVGYWVFNLLTVGGLDAALSAADLFESTSGWATWLRIPIIFGTATFIAGERVSARLNWGRRWMETFTSLTASEALMTFNAEGDALGGGRQDVFSQIEEMANDDNEAPGTFSPDPLPSTPMPVEEWDLDEVMNSIQTWEELPSFAPPEQNALTNRIMAYLYSTITDMELSRAREIVQEEITEYIQGGFWQGSLEEAIAQLALKIVQISNRIMQEGR